MDKIKRLFDRTEFLLGCGIVAYIAIFFTLAILRYKSFFSYEWEDLADMNKLYWNISQGHFHEYLQFYDQEITHFFPVMFLISAIYFLLPHIYTLFFITTFSLAIAAIPVYLIAKSILKDKKTALILAFAYLLYAPKNSLNFLDNDPSILTIPLLLFIFYAILEGKKKLFWVLSTLIMSCMTYTPVSITVLATYFFIRRNEFNKIGAKTYLAAGFLSLAFLLMNISIADTIGQKPVYETLVDIFQTSFSYGYQYFLAHHPFELLNNIKIHSTVKIFLPLIFLPLFTWETLLGLPSILLILTTDDFLFQRAHYISGLIPFLFIATIFIIKKIQNHPRPQDSRLRIKALSAIFRTNNPKFLATTVLIGCFLSNFLPNIIGGPHSSNSYKIEDTRFVHTTNIYDPLFYTLDDDDEAAWRMIDMIPQDPSITVTATGDLLAPLSSRMRLMEFLDPDYDYYDTDYILIHGQPLYNGAGHYFWDSGQVQKELNDLLKDTRWENLAAQNDLYLFKRKDQRRGKTPNRPDP